MSMRKVKVRTVRDYGLDHMLLPFKGAFNAETYVGNWYEETWQNTMKRRDFMNKRECEELSIQKSQIMTDILLKPVCLTARRDLYVYFGDSVQIISPGPDCASVVAAAPFKDYCNMGHLVLSASVPPTLIDHQPYLDTDSIISASPHLYPCVRNSFVIERPDCPDDNNSVLHYGDVFRIRAMPTQHWTLYLHSAPNIPHHAASIHSARPLVRFSDTANPNTLWRIMPLDPLEQLKVELGIPVPLKTRCMLQHALSGHNLSVETDFPVYTYFGCELEVTVHSKRNRHKKVEWTNHWVIDTERGWSKPDKKVLEQAKLSAAINANMVTKSPSEEEREKEKLRREQEGDDDDEECYKEVHLVPELKIRTVNPRQDETGPHAMNLENCGLENAFESMHINKSIPGHERPYDWRTAPQPHAHEYRLSEQKEFFPNKKYGCCDTQCCHNRAFVAEKQKTCPCPPQAKCYDLTDQYNENRKYFN